MWSFVPTPGNADHMEILQRNLEEQGLELNRSAFINRALKKAFQRMKARSHDMRVKLK